MRSVQKGISALFLVVAILAIAIASTAGYFVFSQNLKEKVASINSFEDCAKHYPVMESYPEQCKTPDGKYFTRELSEEEKHPLVPSTEPSPSAAADETANWKTYTNTKYGFSIKYPETVRIEAPPQGVKTPNYLTIHFQEAEEYMRIEDHMISPFILKNEMSLDAKRANTSEATFLNKPAIITRPARNTYPGEPFKGLIVYDEEKESKFEIFYYGDGRNETLADQIAQTFKFLK